MSEYSPSVRVHVNIDLSAASIQAVVANSKKRAGANQEGRHQMDTADVLAALISKFLLENDFDAFVQNVDHY